VTVFVPGGAGSGENSIDGVTVESCDEGTRLANGQKLSSAQTSEFAGRFQNILSVANFGAATLAASGTLAGRVWRHCHMVARDRDISTYLGLTPSLTEKWRMNRQRRNEITAEALLVGTPAICVSRFVRSKLVSSGLAKSSKVRVIPNGVDTRTFRPKDISKKYDLLYVGRFQSVKGPDLIFEAVKAVGRRMGQVRLGVVGEFERRHQDFLTKILGSSPVAVEFLGKVEREEMPEVINRSRFLVMPSRYESFGLPVLEAIACGVPALASNLGGLPELVDPSVGLLFPDLEPENMAGTIEAALRSRTLEAVALREGPIIAMVYDWRVIAKRVLEALGEI
jgi:glycosyltransferase involved in cell wall biosynthesis